MKKLLALALLIAGASPALAANNYGVIVSGGGTVTFCAKDTGGGILSVCHVLTDSTGTPFGTSGNPLFSSTAITAVPNPADVSAAPTLNTGTVGTYAEFPAAGANEISLEITNLPAGAVLSFQRRVGSTVYNATALPAGAGNVYVGTASANGVYHLLGGGQYVRVTVTTAATGTANLTWVGSAGLGVVSVKQSNPANLLATVTPATPNNGTSAQVTATATAALAVAGRPGRQSVTVINTTSTTFWIGFTSGVTTTTGLPVAGPNGSLTLAYTGPLYVLTATGTSVLAEYELY